MDCPRCGFDNHETVEFCLKCGSLVADTQQTVTQSPTEGCSWHMLWGIPGIVLLFVAGPAYVYHFELHGLNPSTTVWILSIAATSSAVALFGATILRCRVVPSVKTRNLIAVAFIFASSVCFVALGMILVYWSRLDLRYEYEPDWFAFSAMIAGVSQSVVAAIEWNRLKASNDAWRILSVAIAFPSYALAIYLVFLSLTVGFGTS